jgi:hypothetical protein
MVVASVVVLTVYNPMRKRSIPLLYFSVYISLNGGVNLISSFHVIGEIFDTVYPEGSLGEGGAKLKNVQTTAVLPGGSTIVEFTVDVPGKFLLVDHALSRMNKGAWAVLEVAGEKQPDIYSQVSNDYMVGVDVTSGTHKGNGDVEEPKDDSKSMRMY